MHAHPRLGLNAELLRDIQKLRQSGNFRWTRFQEWMDAEKAGRQLYIAYGGENVSALFGYVTTADPAMFEIARKNVAPAVLRDPANPSLGLRPFFGKCKEADYCDDHEAASNGGHAIADVALLYDWGNDRLTPAMRGDLIAMAERRLLVFADEECRGELAFPHRRYGGNAGCRCVRMGYRRRKPPGRAAEGLVSPGLG